MAGGRSGGLIGEWCHLAIMLGSLSSTRLQRTLRLCRGAQTPHIYARPLHMVVYVCSCVVVHCTRHLVRGR